MSPHVHTQGGWAAVLLAADTAGSRSSAALSWFGVTGGRGWALFGVEGQVQRLALLRPGGGGRGG